MNPTTLLRTGVISFALTRILGATWGGAAVMGLGGVLWEAGAMGIPAGWKRYVLGIFSAPE